MERKESIPEKLCRFAYRHQFFIMGLGALAGLIQDHRDIVFALVLILCVLRGGFAELVPQEKKEKFDEVYTLLVAGLLTYHALNDWIF